MKMRECLGDPERPRATQIIWIHSKHPRKISKPHSSCRPQLVCITVKCKKARGKIARNYDILKKTKHGVKKQGAVWTHQSCGANRKGSIPEADSPQSLPISPTAPFINPPPISDARRFPKWSGGLSSRTHYDDVAHNCEELQAGALGMTNEADNIVIGGPVEIR